MIGVSVRPSERAAAQEFFELFKTPWEFFDASREYEVLISTTELPGLARAELTVVFSPNAIASDAVSGFTLQPRPSGTCLTYSGRRLPIHGIVATFSGRGASRLVQEESSQESALHARRSDRQTAIRIGYNLFAEVHFLLTVGQPFKDAREPTLELHRTLLRDIITRAELPIVEIPPVPAGYQFMVCLTHDIDHPLMRNHRWDHTMFGFLYRAALVSPISVCRGRISFARMLQNWAAVVRLPFVHLGLARDPWSEFDHYLEIEAGLGSTYFVIPKRDDPGRKRNGAAPSKRACRYSLAELATQLGRIVAAGKEVGVHGLDAWMDPKAGREEREILSRASEGSQSGVRMHWLYFDEKSHLVLEEAGYSYDSTVGYNNTIGFRAGTVQAYRPLGNSSLLELPLHAMDTALFYPSYLDLGERAASRLISDMLDDMEEFGGAFTLNWHDRSLFAERLWGSFYVQLIDELKRRRAWFPTAAQAVAWFRKRRNAAFESVRIAHGRIEISGRASEPDELPGLEIRIHRPCRRLPTEALAMGSPAGYFDLPFAPSIQVQLQN